MIITEKQLILLFDIANSVSTFMKTRTFSLTISEKDLDKLLTNIYSQQSNELIEVK